MMIYVITVLIVVVIILLMTVLARMTEQKIENRITRDEIMNGIKILSSQSTSSELRMINTINSGKNELMKIFSEWFKNFKEQELLEVTNSLRTLLKHIYFKGISAIDEQVDAAEKHTPIL